MTQACDYLSEMDYPLYADLRAIADGFLTDRELQFLAPILALLVLAFSPRGTRPPHIDFDDLSEAFRRAIQVCAESSSSKFEEQFQTWLGGSSQPELLVIFMSAVAALSDQAPAGIRPNAKARAGFFMILRIIIDELDRAMRE